MKTRIPPFRDKSLVEFLGGEPELLAIADALVTTRSPEIRPARIRHRVAALAGVAAIVLVTGLVTLAILPGSSQTSTGLSRFSTIGNPVSFAGEQPSGLGVPYVLARFDGKAFFRVRQIGPTAMDRATGNNPHLGRGGPHYCYGDGPLAEDGLHVWMLDCTPFPSPERPVLLAQVGEDVSGGNASLLFVQGFAADGVARLDLLAPDGDIVAETTVQGNVFHFGDVSGRAATGELVAFDHEGREVWRHPL